MTNEKNRRQDIFALAARIKQAKADWEECDLSEFSLGDVSNLGIPNYAIAKALYDSGYRMTALDEVTVIVKDGRVTNVYASNDNLAVNVMDFDGLDEDEYTALAEEEASARQRQSSVW